MEISFEYIEGFNHKCIEIYKQCIVVSTKPKIIEIGHNGSVQKMATLHESV